TTDASGNADFVATLTTPVPAGQQFMAATATDSLGNTSEFSGNVAITHEKATTASTVSAAPNPSGYGQSVTFTATVAATGLGTPTGTVRFVDGLTGSDLGTVALSGGTATLSTATLAAGLHIITVSYSGVSDFQTSSGNVTQRVNPAALIITASGQTKVYGDANPTFTVSYSGFVLGQDASVLGGSLSF